MRAFVLAVAAAMGLAGQAGAVTYYGSLDGLVPPEPFGPVPPSGAEITFWTDDGWETANWHSRSVGRFSEARFGFDIPWYDSYAALAFGGVVGEPGWIRFESGEWNGQLVSLEPTEITVVDLIHSIRLSYWCWFGCEYPGRQNDAGIPVDVFTRVDDGNDWQVRFVLGALVPDPLPAAVPLPAAAPLLLTGAAGLFALGRRRKARG